MVQMEIAWSLIEHHGKKSKQHWCLSPHTRSFYCKCFLVDDWWWNKHEPPSLGRGCLPKKTNHWNDQSGLEKCRFHPFSFQGRKESPEDWLIFCWPSGYETWLAGSSWEIQDLSEKKNLNRWQPPGFSMFVWLPEGNHHSILASKLVYRFIECDLKKKTSCMASSIYLPPLVAVREPSNTSRKTSSAPMPLSPPGWG